MILLIQRVTHAYVKINEKKHSSINKGLLIFFCAMQEDTQKEADLLADKVANLRIFPDESGKMNLSAKELSKEMLVVSQFTLAATLKGRRPYFKNAKAPAEAEKMYLYFIQKLNSQSNRTVQCGVFGKDMQIGLENDGPVTIYLDSNDL